MRSKLINRDTIHWLSMRNKSTAPLRYRVLPTEYKMHMLTEKIFEAFDKNENGFLELNEMQKMFANNNINITMDQLKKLFKVVGKHAGHITLDEFKKFTLSSEASEKFRTIFSQALRQSECNSEHYSPDFNRLISKFHQNGAYKKIEGSLESVKNKFGFDNALLVSHKFNELFEAIKIKNEVIESFKLESSSPKVNHRPSRRLSLIVPRDSDNVIVNESSIKQKSEYECRKIFQTARKEAHSEALLIKSATRTCYNKTYEPFAHKSPSKFSSRVNGFLSEVKMRNNSTLKLKPIKIFNSECKVVNVN